MNLQQFIKQKGVCAYDLVIVDDHYFRAKQLQQYLKAVKNNIVSLTYDYLDAALTLKYSNGKSLFFNQDNNYMKAKFKLIIHFKVWEGGKIHNRKYEKKIKNIWELELEERN